MLKILDNGRRAPLIPPVQTSDKFITSFAGEAGVFNDCSAKQCWVIDSNSQIPDRNSFCTNEFINEIKFVDANMLEILKNLNIMQMTVNNLNYYF